jgi:O-antigen/teichoic acid export membrane protein
LYTFELLTMKDRIAKSVFWIVWSRGGIQLLSFLSTIMVARLLSPKDFGLMALAGIWTYAIALFAEMGFGAAIIKFPDLEEGELSACFWITVGVAIAGYLGLFIAAPMIAVWFSSPHLTNVLRVVGLGLPLEAFRVIPDGLLRQKLKLDKVSQAEFVAAAFTIPLVIGLAWAGVGVWALVAGVLVKPFIQGVVTFWFVRWCPCLKVYGSRLKEVLHFSLATLGARASYVIYQQADVFVFGKLFGAATVGFYSMAFQLAELPASKVSAAVNNLTFPIMAKLQTNPEAMRNSLVRIIRLVVCATLPMCIGMMLVADDLVRVTLGDKWMDAVPLLQVLCICSVVRSGNVLLPPVLRARNRADFLFYYHLTALGIMPLAFWGGAHWLGQIGVPMAWLVVYPFLMIWMAREALKEIGMAWKTFWTALWPMVFATFVMATAIIAVRLGIFVWWGETPLGRLVLSLVVGVGSYSIVLFGMGGPIRQEIKEVIGWMIKRGEPYDRFKTQTI